MLDYDSEREGPHLPDCLLPQDDYPCACCQEITCEMSCICSRLQAARFEALTEALARVSAVTDEQDTAVWFERFRDDPDDLDKVTIMVQLDRVIAAIQHTDTLSTRLDK